MSLVPILGQTLSAFLLPSFQAGGYRQPQRTATDGGPRPLSSEELFQAHPKITSAQGERVMASDPWQDSLTSLGLKDREGKAMPAAAGKQPRNDRMEVALLEMLTRLEQLRSFG
jgi:hypothetical protein